MLNTKIRKVAKLFALILSVSLLVSCTKEENLPKLELGLNYFPLRLTAVTIYDVDSVVYNDFNNAIITYKFQLKDSVLSKYKDLVNKEVFRIERFKKTATTNWTFQQVIIKNLVNTSRAEEFSDNHRFVRLVFPQSLGLKWNGNLYNSQGEWPYEIIKFDEKTTIGARTIDSTLTVSQYNEVNLIREDVFSEIYARQIGLIGKNIRAIDKDISTGRIKKGLIYTLRLNSNK